MQPVAEFQRCRPGAASPRLPRSRCIRITQFRLRTPQRLRLLARWPSSPLLLGAVILLFSHIAAADRSPTAVEALQGIWSGQVRKDWGEQFTVNGTRISTPKCAPIEFAVVHDRPTDKVITPVDVKSGQYREIVIQLVPEGYCYPLAPVMLFTIIVDKQPTSGGSISTFRSIEDLKLNEPRGWEAWGREDLCALDMVSPTQSQIPGELPSDRIQYLRELQRCASQQQTARYLELALNDTAPEVREYAALFALGYLPLQKVLVLLTEDPHPEVRSSIASGFSHMTTDNGTESCENASMIEDNLPAFLRAANDRAASPNILEIFGARYSGDTVLPCCFSPQSRAAVQSALLGLPHSDRKSEALAELSKCAEIGANGSP